MKKILYFVIILIATACSDDNDLNTTLIQESLEDSDFKWEEVYRYNFKTNNDVPTDINEFQAATRTSTIQIGEEAIYPSQNIVLSQFLQTGRWNEVFCNKNPHSLIFNFYPVPYVETITNPQDHLTYSLALGRAMTSDAWDISSQSGTTGSAEASFKDVKTYSEFNLAFGANLSVGKFFSTNMSYSENSKKYKTVFIARFKASNFDIITHVNDKITNERLVYDSQSYVSSLTFGKVAYLVIYSNYSYDEVKKSINAAFSYKLVEGGANYSKETLDILSSSESYAWVKGNNVTESFYGNTAAFLEQLFTPVFNKTTIGVPVFFQLRKAGNNELVDTYRDYDSWIENPIIYIEM